MSRPLNPVGRRRFSRLLRASIVPGLALATLLASFSASYGAERVGVRAGLHETFARLVFDWNGPVSYQLSATDEQLTVTFGRPMEGRFDNVRWRGNVRKEP